MGRAWGAVVSACRAEGMGYCRHEPEATTLYRLVEQYWPELEAQLEDEILSEAPVRQWVISFPFQRPIMLSTWIHGGTQRLRPQHQIAPTGLVRHDLLPFIAC